MAWDMSVEVSVGERDLILGVVLGLYWEPSPILTGRFATHPVTNSKLVASLLIAAVGKWHMGFYRDEYTPTFRGYSSFLGFYGGGENYFTHVENDGYDFRYDSQPNCGTGNSCSKVDIAS